MATRDQNINNISTFKVCTIPDSQHGERAILHAKSKMDSIGADGGTANGLLHVAAGNQSMVY